MPEQPADPDDRTIWCDVCQERVAEDYAHAHNEKVPPEAWEHLQEIINRRDLEG